MKKILVVLCAVLLFMGCGCEMNDKKPDEAVETFFEKYRSKDDDIITQLKDTIKNEDLTDDAKEKYEKLMEKQYDQFAYVIKDTKEEEKAATVTVELTVLNYRSAILKAEEELKAHPEKFNDEEGKFSEDKYMDYKIEKMSEVTDTTTHTVDLSLTKENGMWKVDQLSSDDISKLHGLY
ncbi:MAG: hypothetical protein U0M66_01325 [Bacilli bacterium]|nr:hypothetical protein [Bacilli bacterium]